MKSTWILLLFLVISPCLNSQSFTSRNNFTGNWDDANSWDSWNDPSDSVYGTDLLINGYISIRSSLTLSGTSSTLTIHDTLVIYGDLNLGNNINLEVHSGGILIIRGNLTINNNTDIFTNGTVIITGDFANESHVYDGSFWTTGNPSHVFIAGTVPVINDLWYPVLDCDNPLLDPFSHSGCAYGNTSDLMDDPISWFYATTCNFSGSSGSNSPVCKGQTLELYATGGSDFLWSGPASFSSNISNPIIENAEREQEGDYVVKIAASGCIVADTIHVIIHDNPDVTASINSPVCEGEAVRFSASGANDYSWAGPVSFSSDLNNPVINNAGSLNAGLYIVKGTSDGCTDTDTLFLMVTPLPVADAGEDQVLEYSNNTTMQAVISGAGSGTWLLVKGSGIITEPGSPGASVTGLADGENIFRWTVSNGNCQASDETVIRVIPLFIPNVITPNSDGKNDFLVISAVGEGSELIIFNRWGITEYTSHDYRNNWDGVKNSGEILPDDTYYYVLKFRNGTVRKGSVLIKRK